MHDGGRSAGDPPAVGVTRRDLLLRAGVVGAGAAAAGLWPARARADVPESLEWLLRQVANPALELLGRDTYAGLAAFAVPGTDRWSLAQGVAGATPGGVAARAPELIARTLDFYVAWPDAYVHALAAAFRTGVSEVPIPSTLLGGLLNALEVVGATLDDALRLVLRNDATLPISLPVALLMNVAATQVRPTAVVGPIAASPFANLSWTEKGQAFERIERADPDLLALIDANAPQPLREGASGLLRFVGNVLLTLAPFAAYSEFGVFDRTTRTVTRRPLGWDLSRYMPGRTTPADGWPELIGYYQDRRAVRTAPEYGG